MPAISLSGAIWPKNSLQFPDGDAIMKKTVPETIFYDWRDKYGMDHLNGK